MCHYFAITTNRVKQLDDEVLKLPFMADKGYGSVDIIGSLLDR